MHRIALATLLALALAAVPVVSHAQPPHQPATRPLWQPWLILAPDHCGPHPDPRCL
jgi:hypothetical protein